MRRKLPDRLDLAFPGIGRLHKAHGASSRAEYDRRVALLQELYTSGGRDGWQALEAIRDGRFSVTSVVAAVRAGRLPDLWADLVLGQALATTVDAWLPQSARAPATRQRYAGSWASLQRAGVVPPTATLRGLQRIAWRQLQAGWPGGKHDWKHLRGFVSRFLSVQLGVDHPFRKAVLQAIPRPGTIPPRVPDVTPAAFWKAVEAMPDYVRAAPVAILATGMRIGEFCRCQREDLLPLTKQVHVPGTKTEASDAHISVDPELWPWVERAIPCPVGHWRLRELWRRARRAAGIEQVTVHDLRHCLGQWLLAAGRPITAIRPMLRHTSLAMTMSYVEQLEKGENAKTIAAVLQATAPPGLLPTASSGKRRTR
jgi:integrase